MAPDRREMEPRLPLRLSGRKYVTQNALQPNIWFEERECVALHSKILCFN